MSPGGRTNDSQLPRGGRRGRGHRTDLYGKGSSQGSRLQLKCDKAVLVGSFPFTMNIYHFHNKNDFSFRKQKATASASSKPEVEANGHKRLRSRHPHTSGPHGGSRAVVGARGRGLEQ